MRVKCVVFEKRKEIKVFSCVGEKHTSERHITRPIARPKKKASVYSKERETHALVLIRQQKRTREHQYYGDS